MDQINPFISHGLTRLLALTSYKPLLPKPKEDAFSQTLLKIYNYDEVVSQLARHINLDDPSKIRLTSHNCWDNGYRITSIATTCDQTALILSVPRRKPDDETQETLCTSQFPSTHIKE
nr:protein kinase-like protein [Tanacetum cinerariifolium]